MGLVIPVAAFDTETTGVDVEADRIVQAAVVLLDAQGTAVTTNTWLLNPGVPIPEGATAVHGITTEHALAHGIPAADGIEAIANTLALYADAGYPIVVYNAPFDLALLDREIRRHEVGAVGSEEGVGGIWWDMPRVLDPLVIDKTVDRYRKGKRTLTALAEHLNAIEFAGTAHGAVDDATTAGRIAQYMLTHPLLAGRDLDALHQAQIGWARSIATSLADYLHRQGRHDEALTVRGTWPYATPGDDEPYDPIRDAFESSGGYGG